MSEPKRRIKLDIVATLEIDSRDECLIANWDIEHLRNIVYDIGESSVDVDLGGIRATVKFITPTPFELKVAEVGSEVLESMYVSPLAIEPEVQVICQWRHKIASLYEVFEIRRLLPALHKWRMIQIVERAKVSPHWVLGVCHPARAVLLVKYAEQLGLKTVVEPFLPPVGITPEQFSENWGCETPESWWQPTK